MTSEQETSCLDWLTRQRALLRRLASSEAWRMEDRVTQTLGLDQAQVTKDLESCRLLIELLLQSVKVGAAR